MAFGGVALKLTSFTIRLIQLACSVIILGIFSYFLATLHNHHIPISTTARAVEGISGAAVLYTLIALLLVFCLGGIAILGAIAILLDIAFAGAFGYLAYANRGGIHSCSGNVNTFLGSGDASSDAREQGTTGGFTHIVKLSTACRLEKACFAVAIIGAFFFLLSVLTELGLMRHHKKEKAFGPGPHNDYTAGTGTKRGGFFARRRAKKQGVYTTDAKHPDALPTHSTPADMRTSYAPTESTAVGGVGEPGYDKYGHTGTAGGLAGTTAATHGHHHGTTTHTHTNTTHHNGVVHPTGTAVGPQEYGHDAYPTGHVPGQTYQPYREGGNTTGTF